MGLVVVERALTLALSRNGASAMQALAAGRRTAPSPPALSRNRRGGKTG